MAKPTSLRSSRQSIGSRTRSKRPGVSGPSLSIEMPPPKSSRSKERGQNKSKKTKAKRNSNGNNDVDGDNRNRGEEVELNSAEDGTATATVENASKRRRVGLSPDSHGPGLSLSLPRNITPSPTLALSHHLHNTDTTAPIAFPSTWQSLSHSNLQLTLPAGVINLSSQTHQCCLHSTISHQGYSWLTSQRRCPCYLDSDHNTSDSLTHCFVGHYGGLYVGGTANETSLDTKHPSGDEWGAERWWLNDANASTNKVTTASTTSTSCTDAQIQAHLDYIQKQPHLTQNMRGILMDWMVEMSMEYRLHSETVYLSVYLVDRALACVGYEHLKKKDGKDEGFICQKDMLQCVGCACTLIASKLLEITPPTIQDFCYISDNSYTTKQILDCEARICSLLKFNFNYQTPYRFIHMFLRACFATRPRMENDALKTLVERMVLYFVDLSLLEYNFVMVKSSKIAAAAVYLARATLGIRDTDAGEQQPAAVHPSTSLLGSNVPSFDSFQRSSAGFWSKTLEHYTGYDKWDLEESVKMLRRLHENAESNHLKSIFVKFKSEAYGKVAFKTVLNEEDLGFF